MLCREGFLSNTERRMILMSTAFSIKLGDVFHRFLYNHIKQYCAYKTIPTTYLQHCLEHCCKLWTTRKRKEIPIRRPLQEYILHKLIKNLGKQNKSNLTDSQIFVLVKSYLALLEVNTAHVTITTIHRLLSSLSNENANCLLLTFFWSFGLGVFLS